MCGYKFLSRGFTDRPEILHGGLATSQTGLLQFGGGIAPGMVEFWASTGAIWRDMLLTEALSVRIFGPNVQSQSVGNGSEVMTSVPLVGAPRELEIMPLPFHGWMA